MKLSCIQTNSNDSLEDNIASITALIKGAAAEGAQLAALPESAFFMGGGRAFHESVFPQSEHPAIHAMQALAKSENIAILIGSIAVTADAPQPQAKPAADASKPLYANRQLLIDQHGDIIALYDKIHLFDVSIPEGESHKESDRFSYGENAITADYGGATFGLSICYDLRFPQLYRSYGQSGVDIITTPAAFTYYTGAKGHWHILNQARAIENQCFILAPAQCGHHPANRRTYGHSLIIDPWGKILAEASEDTPQILTAEIDLSLVAEVRKNLPSLQHDRDYSLSKNI